MSKMGNQSGFTLLEMVVAIAIFAIIATISYTTLSQFTLTRNRLAEHQQRITQLQNTFSLLARDFRYASNRSVRNNLGETENALVAAPFEFSNTNHEIFKITTAWRSPANSLWNHLERVSWRIEDQHLIRSTWLNLDQSLDSKPVDITLVDNIRNIELRFYQTDENQQVLTKSEWDKDTLPKGIEVLLTLDDNHSYRRVFTVASSN